MCAGSTVTLTADFQLDFLLLNVLGTVTGTGVSVFHGLLLV